MEFNYKEQDVTLVKAQLNAIYKNTKLLYENYEDASVERFELPLLNLNKILSNRYFGPKSGFALGRLHNFYGMESVGKTALAMQIAGILYNAGAKVLWVDAERSFDAEYAYNAYGIDVDDKERFILALPDYGEQAFDIVELFVKSGTVSLAVVDSIAALGTKRTNEALSDKDYVGEVARRIGPHFEKVIKPASDNKCSVIYINQLRDNIIQMGGMMKSAGKKFGGGNAMKFYPHVALKFTEKKEIFDSNENFVGLDIEIFADKNKTAKPKLKNTFLLVPGEGFSVEMDLITLAVEYKIVKMSGSWYSFNDTKIGQGVNQVRKKLCDKPELFDQILKATKNAVLAEEMEDGVAELDLPQHA